jgi:hypothetical protein
MKLSSGIFAIVSAFLFLAILSSPCFPDVMVERTIKTGGAAAAEIHEIDYIKGMTKRTDSKMKFTGKVVGMFTKPKDLSTIYRVDQDLIWEVNHTKKTYTERPISLSEEERKDQSGHGEEVSKEEKVEDEREKDEVRIVRNEFSIKETGEKKTINGFPCRQYLLTWLVETENLETKERSKSIMTGDFWNAPEEKRIVQLMAEEGSFNRAYLKKLGLEMTPDDMKKFGLKIIGGMMGAMGDDLKKEMAKMKGFPIATSIKWEAEGDRKEEPAGEEKESVDLSKGVKGVLGGLFKKKAKESMKEKEGDRRLIFESHTEIKSIDTSPFPGSQFEVPKEYSKEKGSL